MNSMRSGWLTVLLLLFPTIALAQSGSSVQLSGSRNDAATAVGHSHTSAATITLTPTSGQFVYITGLDVSNCSGAAAVTAAAATYVTTTNITGAPQYQVGTGLPVTGLGTCQPTHVVYFTGPVRSSVVTTAVTFVLPTFATNQTISVNVYWYSGN